MVDAYVVVITAAGTSSDVLESASSLPGVEEGHVVAGEYDVILEIRRDSVADILHVVSTELGAIDAVGTTRTYIAID